MSLAWSIEKSYWLASPWVSKGLPEWHSGKKIHLPVQETEETQVWFLGQEDPLEEEMATHSSSLAWKIPWTEEPGRLQSTGSQRAGHDWAHMHGLLNYNTSHIQLIMEKEMATHSNILAWRIPGTEEPGGVPSMGLHRVGHDWSDLAAAAAYKLIFQKYMCVCVWVAQSCPTLWDPMDCIPPGSSDRGMLQARIPERIDVPISRGSSWPRNRTQVSPSAWKFFTI